MLARPAGYVGATIAALWAARQVSRLYSLTEPFGPEFLNVARNLGIFILLSVRSAPGGAFQDVVRQVCATLSFGARSRSPQHLSSRRCAGCRSAADRARLPLPGHLFARLFVARASVAGIGTLEGGIQPDWPFPRAFEMRTKSSRTLPGLASDLKGCKNRGNTLSV